MVPGKTRLCDGRAIAKATNLGQIAWLRRLLPIVLSFALSGCVAGNLAMEAQVQQYSGDGVIHTCSNILMPGYNIEFARFNSAKPYEASYRLSHVPPTHREPAVIYLRFDAPELSFLMSEKKKKSVTATFRFTLYDAKGEILHAADFRVSNSTWSGNRGVFGIYDVGKSHLRFDPSATYSLKVSYTPGAIPPPAKQLYFAIDNCAFY